MGYRLLRLIVTWPSCEAAFANGGWLATATQIVGRGVGREVVGCRTADRRLSPGGDEPCSAGVEQFRLRPGEPAIGEPAWQGDWRSFGEPVGTNIYSNT